MERPFGLPGLCTSDLSAIADLRARPGLSTNRKLPTNLVGTYQTAFLNADEVKALSPYHRFVIALHSPRSVAETGLCVCPPEKTQENLPAGFDWTHSPVRFTCGIVAISSDSCSNAARFLCGSDCVAERVRFEPSLPFVRAAKSRCVRYIQRILHTRLIRRIASALESGKTVPFHIPPNGERLAIVIEGRKF
jgi:hypothetical protein